MAAFATTQIKDHPDPLQSRRSAAEWLQKLPALDVIARQERVIHAFEEMRHACAAVDFDRIAAIEYLDAALEVDQRRLVKWYLENLQRTPALAERFWTLANDVNRGFISAYHAALEDTLANVRERRWRLRVPLLIARLVHCHGVDAKLRLFRNERWIPAKWAQLHQLFLRAAGLGAERVPTALESADSLAPRWSVEQEYIYVLLLMQLDAGNLTPADLDWASVQLRAWTRDLTLEPRPTAADGFYVDLSSTFGLIRRTGKDSGARVGYLDTAPLIRRLEIVIAELAAIDPGAEPAHPRRRLRIATLEKLRPSLAPSRSTNLRRHPRIAVDLEATVHVGLAGITADLAPDGTARAQALGQPRHAPHPPAASHANGAAVLTASPSPAVSASGSVQTAAFAADNVVGGIEEIEIHPVRTSGAAGDRSVDPPPAFEEPPPPAQEPPRWRVADRSVNGWRLVAPRGAGNGLALGALVAVRPETAGDWMLGVVRRVRKGAHDEVEAGMSLITEHAVPVTLRARRSIDKDMDFEVDGNEPVSVGGRFSGLYLMPPSRAGSRESLRTLIIPTSEHFEGRSLFLTTSRSNYAVTLRHVVDQQADWSWVTIQVSGRAARLAN